jgi:hypothetical protein
VIGFDDVPCRCSPLSVDHHTPATEVMGSLAVNVIMEGVNANLEKRDVNIAGIEESELVIRESTRTVKLSGADD